ncbi:LysR family transcriptional regulator [Gammaproteobacteria bacterium AB-CW1]|uniref:LysR family transcriptional regulator n=1 Tax=Natronospira elongata TaxID=3110268 RepID=A0AAP6JEL4_9GAMM|nr:LysR family transcriptional regulator [Gammaproteobacteria bacterium AB-CW1]
MKSNLAQWRALQAVVDEGGFARAAEKLNRSQSSVSHAVARLEESLGVQLLRQAGRRAILTEAGTMLLRSARKLLADAGELESLAEILAEGQEAELHLAVDGIFPSPLLYRALGRFSREAPGTRVEVFEEVLGGATEAVEAGQVDLAIAPSTPAGYLGEPIMDVAFVPVAHPDHALHRLKRSLTGDDLRRDIQVVIRDSARRSRQDSGWLGAPRRWTVTSLRAAAELVAAGIGFSWLPEHLAAEGMEKGELAPLHLQDGGGKRSHLYLIQARSTGPGPAARLLADCLRQAAAGSRSQIRRPDPDAS